MGYARLNVSLKVADRVSVQLLIRAALLIAAALFLTATFLVAGAFFLAAGTALLLFGA